MQLTVRTTAEGHPALSKGIPAGKRDWWLGPSIKRVCFGQPPYDKLE